MCELQKFVSALQICRLHKDIRHAQKLHSFMCEHHLDTHPRLGNHLVPVLVDCGCLPDALHVFHKLPHRNEHSWGSIIAGIMDSGDTEHGFFLYQEMQHSLVLPQSSTFVSLLKSCCRLRDPLAGRQIHVEIIKKGLDSDLFVSNTLVVMYGKCECLAEAQQVFDKLKIRDAVSWNALIVCFAEYGLVNEATSCFVQMQLDGVCPVPATYACSLKACGNSGALEEGLVFCADIAKKGLERDLFIGSTMVDMYAKCGSLAEAQDSFSKLPNRDVVSWTALIAGYCEHGFGVEALNHLKQMQLDKVSPVSVTFTCSLKACSMIGDLESGKELHAELCKRKLENDLTVANTLIDMYGKCGAVAEGRVVFEKLPAIDIVSWTTVFKEKDANHNRNTTVQPNLCTFLAVLKACTQVKDLERGERVHIEIIKKGMEKDLYLGSAMVDLYSKCGLLAEARMVFDKLPHRSAVSYSAMIAGYTEHGLDNDALSCFGLMQHEGVLPADTTFSCSLKACGNTGALELGRVIHAETIKQGLDGDLSLATTLVDMYLKCGLLAEGQDVFKKLPSKDVVSWTAMIKGYGENHDVNGATRCFENMLTQGVKPNPVTFTCLLSACSQANKVAEGQKYFKMMRETIMEPIKENYACMIDLLARSGHVYEAERMAKSMQYLPSEEVMMALLTASKTHGDVELGQRCFEQLVQANQEDSSAYLLMAGLCAG